MLVTTCISEIQMYLIIMQVLNRSELSKVGCDNFQIRGKGACQWKTHLKSCDYSTVNCARSMNSNYAPLTRLMLIKNGRLLLQCVIIIKLVGEVVVTH